MKLKVNPKYLKIKKSKIENRNSQFYQLPPAPPPPKPPPPKPPKPPPPPLKPPPPLPPENPPQLPVCDRPPPSMPIRSHSGRLDDPVRLRCLLLELPAEMMKIKKSIIRKMTTPGIAPDELPPE
jgi:hypothetical protein